jgi:hypothetical protein
MSWFSKKRRTKKKRNDKNILSVDFLSSLSLFDAIVFLSSGQVETEWTITVEFECVKIALL